MLRSKASLPKPAGGRPRKGTLEFRGKTWHARLTVDVDGKIIRKWFDLETDNKQVASARLLNLAASQAAQPRSRSVAPPASPPANAVAQDPFRTLEPIAGQRYGRYLVLVRKGARCECRCDCGQRRSVAAYDLRRGAQLQCRVCDRAMLKEVRNRFRKDCEEAAATGGIFVGYPAICGRIEWPTTQDYAVLGGVVLEARDLAKLLRIAAGDLAEDAKTLLSREG